MAPDIVCIDGQLLRFAGAGTIILPMQLQAEAAAASNPRPYQTGSAKNCMREGLVVLIANDPTYTGRKFPALDT